MKEPRRIRDENASPAELSLLRSARLDVPRSDSKRRLLATLGVATAGSAAAAATPGATTAWVVSKWLAAGMLAGTVATGSVEVARSHLDARGSGTEASSVVTPRAQAVERVARTTNASRAPSPEMHPVAPSMIAESRPPRAPSESARRFTTPLPAPSPSAPSRLESPATPLPTLAEEIAALDRARQAREARDPAAALRMLDAFEVSFPKARLEPEARVLRMEVLLDVGRYDDARAIGRRLLESDPSSALSQHVRSLLRNAEAREIQSSPLGH
jgi:hypothetical protein